MPHLPNGARQPSLPASTPPASPASRRSTLPGIVAWRARFPLDVALVAVRQDLPEAAKLAQILLRAGLSAAFFEPPAPPSLHTELDPQPTSAAQAFINAARITVVWVSDASASRMWGILDATDLDTRLLPIYLVPVSVLLERRQVAEARRQAALGRFASLTLPRHAQLSKNITAPRPQNSKPPSHGETPLPSGYEVTPASAPAATSALHRDVALLVLSTLATERSTGWRLVEFSPDDETPHTRSVDSTQSPLDMVKRLHITHPVDAANKNAALAELAAATSGASIAGSPIAPEGAGSGTLLDFASNRAVELMESRWNGANSLQLKSTLAIRELMEPFIRPDRVRTMQTNSVTVLLLGWDNSAAVFDSHLAPTANPQPLSDAASSFNSFRSENADKRATAVVIVVAIRRRIHVPPGAWTVFCSRFKTALDQGRSIEWSYANAIAEAARLPDSSQNTSLTAFLRLQQLYHKNIVLKSPLRVATTPLTRDLMRRGSIIAYLTTPNTKIVFFAVRSQKHICSLSRILAWENYTLLSVNRQKDERSSLQGSMAYIVAVQLPAEDKDYVEAGVGHVEGPVLTEACELQFTPAVASPDAAVETGFNPLNVLYEDWDPSTLAYTIRLHYQDADLRFDDLVTLYAPAMAGVQFATWELSGCLSVKCSSLARSRLLNSVRFLKRAAEAGDSIAQCNLGTILQNQTSGLEPADPEGAIRLFRLAANQRNPVAQSNLGLAYQYGLGVEENMSLAVKWLQAAARSGDPNARYDLANLYFSGVPGILNRQERLGMRLLYLAASEGCNPNAQNDLGLEYESGTRLRRDLGEAAIWYSLAADQGANPVAMVNLANCFFYGGSTASVCQDYQAAGFWYSKALERFDDVVAAQNLAVCHSLGLGADQSARKALELSRIVAEGVTKPSNEDGFFLKHGTSRRPTGSQATSRCITATSVEAVAGRPLGIYVAAEGHGGPAAVDMCEKNTIPVFMAAWQRTPERVIDAMEETFRILQARISEVWKDSFTSLCIIVVRDGVIYCGHVGNCRAVMSRDGHGVLLSDEHIPDTRPDEIERLRRAGIDLGQHHLTRALGNSKTNEPEISVNPIGLVGELIVVATHNFWVKHTSDMAVASARGLLKRYRGNAQRATDKLSKDNEMGPVSVMIIELDPRGLCTEVSAAGRAKRRSGPLRQKLIPYGLGLHGYLRSPANSEHKMSISRSRMNSYTTDYLVLQSLSSTRPNEPVGQTPTEQSSGRLSGSGRFRLSGRFRR